MIPSAPRADDDHEPQDQQRVGEQRADDRGLGDDDLTGGEREDHDEELGQVAQRRLQHARDRGPEARADLLGRERHDRGQRRERDAATTKASTLGAPA